ncbi:MAG: MFS transporter [Alphaproteobacteria bacterium]|jgi:MFS family permease|nr:MFS transporter [Alphaproteobacteria bacterium]MBT4019634.1 MFS transporter [Alphaproteobacteria bacterium]MBT4967097.1 MFS transporter [Alphaproteobacteria bacterium]MBT5161785.1 MFS transporter [Alphaproteobacteria bacterium]MBT5918859.1 MFS transporter [Alphaproteobacteria bacterium]
MLAETQAIPLDGAYAWRRLGIALLLSTIGGIGMWSVIVALPVIQVEFGVDRSDAAFPYTATMLGFAVGNMIMGRLSDRFGVVVPIVIGGVMLGAGYIVAAQATEMWHFVAAQALMIGMLGSSATFGPLVADTSHWFHRRRGVAVAVVASGNYLAGTVWPPILQYGMETIGWRQTHILVGIGCVVTLVPLAFLLRRRVRFDDSTDPATAVDDARALPVSKNTLQGMLIIAGFACCVAMSMPQVHMVAYCVDLNYGMARGAEMLALMLGCGVASRLAAGFISDSIGGVGTLILSSFLQCLALLFYLPFDGLTSLYVVSAFFGLAQGGLVPSYAIIVREYFPAREAGTRVSLVLTATVVGMSFGGWISGEIYDMTQSYQAAFLNGIAFNLVNMSIAFWLLMGRRRNRRVPV